MPLLNKRGMHKFVPMSRSADGGDHMGSDAPSNGTISKSQRHRSSARFRGGFQARWIERLDFVSERRSLTAGNCRIARRRGAADVVPRLNRDRREACRRQLFANLSHVVIAMWGAGHEARGILRKALCERLGHDISELVFGDLVPRIEKQAPAGF